MREETTGQFVMRCVEQHNDLVKVLQELLTCKKVEDEIGGKLSSEHQRRASAAWASAEALTAKAKAQS